MPDKDPRSYWGTFIESGQLNGLPIYVREPKYDPGRLWISKNAGLNTWILTDSDPSTISTLQHILSKCKCIGGAVNCDIKSCEWYWAESQWLLPEVSVTDGICETCTTNDDCIAFRAEICCDGTFSCSGASTNTCIHVGWIKLLDEKIYVLETVGSIRIPIERYGYTPYIKATASATWKIKKGITETGNKHAVYLYDLSLDLQIVALNSVIGGPHYDFKTENPNGTKIWNDGQSGSNDIIVQINDDGLYETDYMEFQIEIFAKDNVFLKSEDLNVMSVVIIAPNGGQRGVVQFVEKQYQVYEQDKTIEIPVERINGTDGDISVEYYVINKKLPTTATFGRDYQEFGCWKRLLHHECKYLFPLMSLLPEVTNLRSAQRYFDIIAESGHSNGSNHHPFATNDFLKSFNLSKTDYQYPIEWNKGFGCCSNTTTIRTYPVIFDYEWLQFRLEWPLDPTIEFDQIWAQMELPTSYNDSIISMNNPSDISLTKVKSSTYKS